MTLRRAHGNSKQGGRLVVVETMPADELPPATPDHTARSDRTPDGRFARGNGVARAQRVRPGLRGMVGADKTSPDFRPFARWGSRYAAHRRRELAAAHGGEISAGVGAMVESAALAMAASRYLDHRARQSGDADLFKQAAQLGQTARQHELSAWELASREATARQATRPREVPWLVSAEHASSAVASPEQADDAEPVDDADDAAASHADGEENDT